jgi:hypothetical protein
MKARSSKRRMVIADENSDGQWNRLACLRKTSHLKRVKNLRNRTSSLSKLFVSCDETT